MSIALDAELRKLSAEFDPLSEDYLTDPYPHIEAARLTAPVFYSEKLDHWVVTRYELIRQIFLNPQVFSAANANSPVLPSCPRALQALEEGGFRSVPTLANVDPPAHTRVRRIANAAFTPKRVSELEPYIREITQRFLSERFISGEADFVRDLAWELPVLVLFRILGVDEDQIPRVKEGSWNRILFIYGRPRNEDEQVTAAEGLASFWRYAETLVADRINNPRNDFTSALVEAVDEDGKRLSPEQAATVVLNLLFAGHETTTGILGNSFRRVLGELDVWKELCTDPTLIPNAVEEVLRLDSSVIAWRRRTTQVATVAGVTIPPNSKLLLLLASGNRDPDVFSNPDRFDIRRPNAKDHLSFGYGAHLCLGRPLARVQAKIVLQEFTKRLPSLRLKHGVQLEFPPNVSFRGPMSLPVVWDE
ncbi:cytochrome P450 [Tardiphaga robiniae]|uniref:Cytochrome P450 n=1 Tax=Tardiphaga robiniae TaxID=943830 RepID=A0A7G6U1K4_9BRAD|nr:cytochrome P450 [Tardiphaga robiniae]QND72886.1 cytochrome P450 [Tardiphaga robiniae]